MPIGFQFLAWRRHKGLSQLDLASRSGLTRPYLSRVERDEVDPSLSTVRRLAAALDLGLGEFLESAPPARALDRDEIDRLARSALHPRTAEARALRNARPLANVFHDKRAAVGLFRARKKRPASTRAGLQVLRRLRAELGEPQWQALLRRVDKLAFPYAANKK